MFFEEPDKQLSNEVPSSEDYQVNATLGQTSYPGTFCNEQVAPQQVTVSASHLFFAYIYVDMHEVLGAIVNVLAHDSTC